MICKKSIMLMKYPNSFNNIGLLKVLCTLNIVNLLEIIKIITSWHVIMAVDV